MPLEGSRERIEHIQPHDIISKGKHYLHTEVENNNENETGENLRII